MLEVRLWCTPVGMPERLMVSPLAFASCQLFFHVSGSGAGIAFVGFPPGCELWAARLRR